MKLRGIDFGCIGNAAGARGFFGEGYSFHRCFQPLGLTYHGAVFVAKTTTINKRPGNMPLGKDGITPVEFYPRCIHVSFLKQTVLNAVGLSGPGAEALFQDGRWQERTEPFFISFAAVGDSSEERLNETYAFVELLTRYLLRGFPAPLGLQVNFSCPNVGLSSLKLVKEIGRALDITAILKRVPVVPKVNILVPVAAARDIVSHEYCDALCVSNTIPYEQLSEKIPWRKLFGRRSPLADCGNGGLSGPRLLPLVTEWIRRAREEGLTKTIMGCGGVVSCEAIRKMKNAGADFIELGSASILRPWMVQTLVNYAHTLYEGSGRMTRAAGAPAARDGVEQVIIFRLLSR